jgi:hypothetical protein
VVAEKLKVYKDSWHNKTNHLDEYGPPFGLELPVLSGPDSFIIY